MSGWWLQPLWKNSQLGWLFQIYKCIHIHGKIKNVPKPPTRYNMLSHPAKTPLLTSFLIHVCICSPYEHACVDRQKKKKKEKKYGLQDRENEIGTMSDILRFTSNGEPSSKRILLIGINDHQTLLMANLCYPAWYVFCFPCNYRSNRKTHESSKVSVEKDYPTCEEIDYRYIFF